MHLLSYFFSFSCFFAGASARTIVGALEKLSAVATHALVSTSMDEAAWVALMSVARSSTRFDRASGREVRFIFSIVYDDSNTHKFKYYLLMRLLLLLLLLLLAIGLSCVHGLHGAAGTLRNREILSSGEALFLRSARDINAASGLLATPHRAGTSVGSYARRSASVRR